MLEILELTGAIITIDAIGCQKEIAAKVRDKKADYVLAVKDNQPHLFEDLSDHFDRVLEDEEISPRAAPRHQGEESRSAGAPDLYLDAGPRGPAQSRGVA